MVGTVKVENQNPKISTLNFDLRTDPAVPELMDVSLPILQIRPVSDRYPVGTGHELKAIQGPSTDTQNLFTTTFSYPQPSLDTSLPRMSLPYHTLNARSRTLLQAFGWHMRSSLADPCISPRSLPSWSQRPARWCCWLGHSYMKCVEERELLTSVSMQQRNNRFFYLIFLEKKSILVSYRLGRWNRYLNLTFKIRQRKCRDSGSSWYWQTFEFHDRSQSGGLPRLVTR